VERLTEGQVRQWYPSLFHTAMRLTGSAEDAGDLTQQAFLKAMRSWEQFSGGAHRLGWIRSILINCVRDWGRKSALRSTTSLDGWAVPATGSDGSGGARNLAQAEQLAALRAAIDALSDPVRSAFVATILDGYTYQQAAEMLDVSVGAIASRVHQARRQLRDVMQQAFPGGPDD